MTRPGLYSCHRRASEFQFGKRGPAILEPGANGRALIVTSRAVVEISASASAAPIYSEGEGEGVSDPGGPGSPPGGGEGLNPGRDPKLGGVPC